MKTYQKIICFILVVAFAFTLSHAHYKYEKANYPISFAHYYCALYWISEPSSAELDPTGDSYIGY